MRTLFVRGASEQSENAAGGLFQHPANRRMECLTCLIKGCQARVYAPAGTHSICRTHFLSYLTWRRRKGPQMFMKYAGMTMEERDPLVAEWANTIRVEEAPTASAPKT